ncbi:MAG TPA: hypothetical protein VMW41_03300 [Candidatus Bathyarchaeia archaeon]|nr:hypothetical protein [Candidatus Bathyarchaeia archaeon]
MTRLEKIFIILVILLILVFINLLVLDYRIFLSQEKRDFFVSPPTDISPIGAFITPAQSQYDFEDNQNCDLGCQVRISEEVAQAIATISGRNQPAELSVRETAKEIPTSVAVPTLTAKTNYLPLGSGSSTIIQDWTDVAGSDFVFNLADYGDQAYAFWQINIRAQHANSRCYARIYDVTNKRAVDFSERSTDQTSYSLQESARLMIWAGKNTYRLQSKSLNGISCYLEAPRLIVVSH